MKPLRKRIIRGKSGFLLLETMIGVAIFAIGVLALAKCFDNLLGAETAKAEDEKARLALQNRMAEIECRAVDFDESQTETLKGMFKEFTLKQTKTKFPYKNEFGQELPGLFIVTLQALWKSPDGPQSKSLSFYVFQPPH